MANATKYVDNVNGNNANTGNSEAQAYADLATAIGAISGGGNIIYVQATGTDYPGGNALTASLKGDLTDGPNRIEGYTTTPGARDGRPVFTSSTNSQTIFSFNDNDYWQFVHLTLTHTAATRGPGFSGGTSVSSPIWVIDCVIDGCSDGAVTGNTGIRILYLLDTEIKNCTGSGLSLYSTDNLYVIGCYIHDNTSSGVQGSNNNPIFLIRSIFEGNGGAGVDISVSAGTVSPIRIVSNCTFAGNTTSGLILPDLSTGIGGYAIVNSIFYSNGAYGVSVADSGGQIKAYAVANNNNAYGSNTSGDRDNWPTGLNDVSLSANPFTNSGSNDFSLNNTAGGGAACRVAGFPGAFPGGTTTGYLDIGAVQHQDAGGTTTYIPFALPRRIAIRERVVRRIVNRIIPGQNTTTTNYVPIPQPRRQYQRPTTPGRRTVVPIISTTTTTQVIPIPKPPRQFVRPSGRRLVNRFVPIPVPVPIPIFRRCVYTARVTSRRTKIVPLVTTVPTPVPFPVPMRGKSYRVVQSRRVPVAAIVQQVTVNQTVLVTTKRTVR